MELVVEPDEGDGHAQTSFGKDMLVRTIGFTDLTLATIALHCTLEVALGHTHENLTTGQLAFLGYKKNSPQREDRQRTAAASCEELVLYLLTFYPLFLA